MKKMRILGMVLLLSFWITNPWAKAAEESANSQAENGKTVTGVSAASLSNVTATLAPTKPGSAISGKATFEETADGLKINVEIRGVPAGKHGFHIHEKGDCSDAGNAAGAHFNPDAVAHGDLLKDGFAHAHAGDLGNIEIDATGRGKLEKTLPGLTLKDGKYSVAGKALILHEKEDNFGQPTGNAGGRIACGVIPQSQKS